MILEQHAPDALYDKLPGKIIVQSLKGRQACLDDTSMIPLADDNHI
jgi:hypothetical protein